MSANFLHGVETIEIDKGPRPIRGVKTAVVGLVGTAPIFQVAAGTVNEPVLILSAKDAADKFGSQLSGYTIPQALDAIFDQGRGIVIVVNVFDPTVHKASQAAAEKTFDTDDEIQLAAGHKGIRSLVVKSQNLATTYVVATDYTIDAANGLITRVDTGNIAIEETVSVTYDYADPAAVTAADVIGEVEIGTGNRTGLQALQDAQSAFGFGPKILIAPVFCTQDSVAADLDVQANALRAICIIDAPIATTFSEALAGRGPAGAINFNYSSERMVLCFPHLKVFDTTLGAERLEPFSQRLAGVICAKDLENGYWWSPSNTEILGITGVERRLTAGINDPSSEVNLLNEAGITTLFNVFGSGMRTWGNRTAAWPSVTHPKNFINIRRTADVLHESVEYSMLQFLDRPITNALISDIQESVNAFIRTLIQRGALFEGKCVYDPAKNPPSEIALGHLTFDIEFMPPTPAERITFESFINIELLASLGAGSSN